MSKVHGPWQILTSTRPYQDDFLEVVVDDVLRPDQHPGRYATVRVKPGVAILPLDREGNVYLVEQFRYALGCPSLEVVAGGVEADEAPLASAKRELKEEIGAEAEYWSARGTIQLDTAIVHCPVHLFVATGLHFGAPAREGSEDIRVRKMPLRQARALVRRGGIVQAASRLLLLTVRRHRAAR
jgi:8-oxo-dGTP pyrophosphatase MutT (NUDIX family)